MKITDVKTFLVHDRERPGRNDTFVKVFTNTGQLHGNLHCGDTPGLGVELDEEAALAGPFQLRPGLTLRRDDNSVTDW